MDADARHHLAETLEPGPETSDRGYDPIDVLRAVQRRDPSFPEVASWDNPNKLLSIDFSEFKRRVIGGEVGILQGNPIKISDRTSPLVHNVPNDIGHAIAILDGDANGTFVMDPMGQPVGSYDGDRVPWVDLKDFASAFSGDGFIFCSLVERGSLREAAEAQRKLKKAKDTISDRDQTIVDKDRSIAELTASEASAKAAKTEALHARDVALTAKTAAETARDEAQVLLGTCSVDLKAAQDALAAAEKARDDALPLLATCSDDLKAAQDALAAAVTAPDTALAQIATCSDDLRAAQDALAAALAALAPAETGGQAPR